MTCDHRTRSLRRQLALGTALGLSLGVFSAPVAAQSIVDPLSPPTGAGVSGDLSGAAGSSFTVNVNQPRAVVDWTSFNVPNQTTANFVNASAASTAVVLNRVTLAVPTNRTTLAGTINAVNNLIPGNGLPAGQQGNGVEVWVANPNGILMGATGNFNTQGFVATTRSFDATDVTNFLAGAGALTLTAPVLTPGAGITGAAGQINSNGRVLAFIAPVVQLTNGTFNAGGGDVGFVIASDVTIANPGSPLGITINAGTPLDVAAGNALQLGGTVNGGNTYVVATAQTGINALLQISAGVTTATASGGVVVLGTRSSVAGPIATAGGFANGGAVRVTASGGLAGGTAGVRVQANGAIVLSGSLNTTGTVDILNQTGAAAVSVTGNVGALGGYSVSGGIVTLGSAGVTQQANGSVTITAATGALTGSGGLALVGDADGTGDVMRLIGNTGIALGGTTLINGDVGGIQASEIVFGTGAANPFALGNVRAGRLTNDGGASGLLTRGVSFTTGDLTLTVATTLTAAGPGSTLKTGAVTAGASTVGLTGAAGVTVNGSIANIAGQAGGVTISTTQANGAVNMLGSELAGALAITSGTGGVGFATLTGTGSKMINSGGGIAGTGIAGAGTVTLIAASDAQVNLTGTLGTAATRLGALTIDGSSGTTIGSAGATGTTAFLTATSIGQNPSRPVPALTVNGTTDHSGAFTSTTTGATTMGDVASGGAFQVRTGAAGATLGALSGAGTKSITSAGSIGASSIRGAGAVALTGAVSATEGVTVNGGIGAAGAPVASLSVDGGNAMIGALAVTGATQLGQGAGLRQLTVTGALDTGSLTSDTIAATDYQGAVRARTGAVDAASGTTLRFGGAVDGPAALTVQAGAGSSVTFDGAVGALQPFTTLTSVGTAAVRLNAPSITTTGAQSYGGPLVLGADATLTGTVANLNNGVNGNNGTRDHDLQLNFSGVTTLASVTGVRALTTDAPGSTDLDGTIATSGVQTYNDVVRLNGVGPVTLTTAGSGAAGRIVFNAAVDGPRELLVTAATSLTFAGPVGAGTPLAFVDSSGAGTTYIRSTGINTAGPQTLVSVVLDGASDMTLAAAGDVTITGLAGPRGLTVNTPGRTIITGNNGAAVAFLTTDAIGTSSLAGTIKSVGDQSYGDPVTLTGNTTLSGTRAIFGAGLTGAGFDLTLNTSGAEVLGPAITGVRNLLTDAAGTLSIVADLTTTGNQTYLDPVTLGASVTLNAGTNLIRFGSTLVSDAGNRSLATLSPTQFDGDVGGAGGTTRLASLQTGGTTTLGGTGLRTVRTVGAQSYGGPLVLATPAALIGSGASFAGQITGTAAHNDLTLTFTGPTTLGPDPLVDVGNLLVNGTGPLTLNGNLTTFGAQTYLPTLVLGAPVTLTSLSGGAIALNAIAGSGQALTVNTAGLTSFAAGAGGLASLQTDAGGSTSVAGTITTSGAQRFGDPLVLAADATFVSTGGGAIRFDGTITGPHALTTTTAGQTTFGGAVGAIGAGESVDATVSPTSVTTTGSGLVRVNGGALSTTGAQSYAGLLQLGNNTVLTGTSGSFGGGIDGNGFDLTLNFSAPTTINGGAFTGVNNFTTGNGGVTNLQGTIVTGGAQTYNNAVVLVGGTTLQSSGGGAIRFVSTVDGNQALRVTTAGQTRFDGAVGTTPLASLLIDGAGPILINGGSVRTNGAQSYAGAVTLGADTLIASGGGNISFGSTIDGTRQLSVRTSLTGAPVAGTVTFAGAVGGITPLTGLAVRANEASAVGGNRVNTLAALINTGGFAFSDLGALTIGTVDGLSGLSTGTGAATIAAGGLLTLAANVTSGGATLTGTGVIQSAGTIVNAGAGAILIDGNDGVLALNGTLITSSGGPGAVRLIDASDALLGAIQTGAGGTLTLGGAGGDNLSGNVTQVAGAAINAGTLVGNIGGSATLTNANTVGTLGAFSSGALALRTTGGLTVSGPVTTGAGALSLGVDGGALVLQGNVTGGSVTLTVAGGITQNAASVLTADTLTGTAAGAVSLAGANRIGTLAGFTTTGAGSGFVLNNAQGLAVTSDVTAAGALTLTIAGPLDFAGRTLTAGSNLTLSAATIAGGTVNASTGALTVNATAAGGALTLASGTAGTTATLDSKGTLVVTGGVTSGGNASLTATGAATVNAAESTGGSLLVIASSVTLGSAPALVAARGRTGLSVQATAGDVTLTNAASGGDATVTATGAIGLGTVGTTASPIAGAVTLTAGGAITGTRAVANGNATATAGGALQLTTLVGATTTSQGTSVSIETGGASSGPLTLTATNGGLTLGTGTAGGSATLTAAGPLTVTSSLTSTGAAAATATGAATIAAITSTNGAVAVSANSAVVTNAKAATTLDVTTNDGALTLGTGNAGGAATLKSAGTLGTTALTAGGAVALTATGAATLGQTTSGAAVTVTAGSIAAGQTNAATTLTLTSGGALSLTGGQAGGNASFDANGTASLGQVLAGASSTITVRALDAAITGTQRAGTVAFVNRSPATTAFKLGDNASSGGFAVSQVEVNNVEAAQLTFDGGAGNVEVGALAFDADAGRTRVDVLTTGRIDVIGGASGSGSGRTFRLGGTTAASDRATTIRVVATADGGGRLLFDTADLDLRGTRIGVGQAAGFLDPIGFGPGQTPQSAATVGAAYVGNANSSLYNSTFGGALYTGSPTLVSARSLTVRYGDYALFQNTGVPGLNSGVVLGSAASPSTPALVVQGPAPSANAFALFGSINGITGTPTAVLGTSVIQVNGADIANTRINGCLVGSGAGCLSAVVSQPLLNTFDASRLNVFRAADDLALPFDPVIGGNNEALFSGFGLIDSPVTDTECSSDQTDPRCGQQGEQGK